MQVPIRTLLVRPQKAFEAIHERPSVLQPALVIFALSIVGIVAALPLYVRLATRFPADIPVVKFVSGGQSSAIPLPLIIGMIAVIIATTVIWLVTAIVLYASARVAGGRGDVRSTVAFVGWSYVPQLLIVTLMIGIAVGQGFVQPGTTATEVLHGTDPLAGDDSAPTMDGNGLMDMHSVFSYAERVWVGYVWVGGLTVVHELSRERAVGIAGFWTVVIILAFT